MTTDHVAVALPGGAPGWFGHGFLALQLPSLVLREVGARLVQVEWPNDLLAARDAPDFLDRLRGHAADAVARLSLQPGDRLTVLAKSLGTMALPGLAGVELPPATEVVWLTPVYRPGVAEAATGCGWRSLFVVGGADPLHDADQHAAVLAATGAAEVVLERADHGLVVDGDPDATLAGARRLVDAVRAFVGPA